MDFADSTPQSIARALVLSLSVPVAYQPIDTAGAGRAASSIIELS